MKSVICFIAENITIIIVVLAAVISLLVLYYLLKYKDSDLDRLKEKYYISMRQKDVKKRTVIRTQAQLLRYERNEKFMKASGLYYLTNGKLTFEQYRMLCIVFDVLTILAGYSIAGIWGGCAGFIIGAFVPALVLKANNNQDNTNMLDSIKQIYDTLRIQLSNDIYVTDALQECYISTTHPRLKAAFYELLTEIHAKSDLDQAVDNFNSKFNNPYIDALSMSIRQSLLTGNISKIFNDISKQMDAIDQAILLREEDKAKRLNTIVQSLVYLGILTTVFYFAILAASDLFTIL